MSSTHIAPSPQAAFFDPAELANHRAALLRFARRRVRDEALAEDAVQDALVSAVASMDSFQGQSALRTWLIGILNHKIQDAFRRESRYVRPSPDTFGGDAFDSLESGMDTGADGLSDDPATEVARWRLGEALGQAIDGLPPTLRDVFQMQVLDGFETDEVCGKLGITESNCWVRLHRARKRLATQVQAHLN